MLGSDPIPIISGLMMFSRELHRSEIDTNVAQFEGTIAQALDENQDAVIALPYVVSAGISMCGNEVCIKVLVLKLSPKLRQQLDKILGQYPYLVEQTDPFYSLSSLPSED